MTALYLAVRKDFRSLEREWAASQRVWKGAQSNLLGPNDINQCGDDLRNV